MPVLASSVAEPLDAGCRVLSPLAAANWPCCAASMSAVAPSARRPARSCSGAPFEQHVHDTGVAVPRWGGTRRSQLVQLTMVVYFVFSISINC